MNYDCKANEEVINILFFDIMRLLADGARKITSPTLSSFTLAQLRDLSFLPMAGGLTGSHIE